MPLYDISPPLCASLGVWPGDAPLSREIQLDMRRGDPVTLSTLHTSVHLGAHADAPSHTVRNGVGIGEQPVEMFLGPCQVIRVHGARGARVAVSDLRTPITAERVLLTTGTFPDPQNWNTDFAGLEVELVDHLSERGVRLIGIDTPSVDLFDSHDLPAHAAILGRGMALLEGLVLQDVPEGIYELIALPLRLDGFEASPVRAILRTME